MSSGHLNACTGEVYFQVEMLIKSRFLDAGILVFIVLSTYNPTLGIIREVFEDFIKICKKWVAIKATHPIKMEFSKLLLHRLYFWSFLRQAHHYVVP